VGGVARLERDEGAVQQGEIAVEIEVFGTGGVLFKQRVANPVVGAFAASPVASDQPRKALGGLRQQGADAVADGIFGLPPDAAGLGALGKSDPRKVQPAILLRAHTTVSNAWIAKRLAMGHPGSASRSVAAGRSTKETLKSTVKIGKMLKCVLWYHSPIRYLDPGNGKTSTGYFWVIHAPRCGIKGDILYQWHPSRKAACLDELLPDYQGNLQTDAYAGYAAWAGGREGIELASCWAHARREFHEALKIGQRLAAGPVAIIAKLYQIEAGLRESRATAERRAETRRQQSTPVLEILKGELLALRQRPEVLPKSRLGRAIDYTLALWDRLLLFVDRGEIDIDNNLTENGIRPTAVGKKNWLFVGSETTGQRAAIIYTMVECAKRHGHNPEAWLTDVLERLPAMTNQDDLSVLLPANWQPATAATAPLRETCPA